MFSPASPPGFFYLGEWKAGEIAKFVCSMEAVLFFPHQHVANVSLIE
jgi:hypothetical protein